MTRHGRNCTASAVYTYHEKQRDSKASGWGSKKARLNKDAVKEFDCCSLSLQPCKDPVVTKDGHLYEREVVLEYILHQKQANAKKLKAYEKQLAKDEKREKEESEKGQQEKVSGFMKLEESITTKRENPFVKVDEEPSAKKKKEGGEHDSIVNTSGSKRKELPSFWIPTLTPHASKSRVDKPDGKIYCPISGKPLRMKDLTTVKFTLAPDVDKSSLIGKKERYICPITKDVLSNKISCVVLKTTGDVVTKACIEKFSKADGVCPLSGKKLSPKDIIELKRGGTGYAKVGGDELKAEIYGASLTCG